MAASALRWICRREIGTPAALGVDSSTRRWVGTERGAPSSVNLARIGIAGGSQRRGRSVRHNYRCEQCVSDSLLRPILFSPGYIMIAEAQGFTAERPSVDGHIGAASPLESEEGTHAAYPAKKNEKETHGSD